jgi:hypothetical protein
MQMSMQMSRPRMLRCPRNNFSTVIATNEFACSGYHSFREMTILTAYNGPTTYQIVPAPLPLNDKDSMVILERQRNKFQCSFIPTLPNAIEQNKVPSIIREHLLTSGFNFKLHCIGYTGSKLADILNELGFDTLKRGLDLHRIQGPEIDDVFYARNICTVGHERSNLPEISQSLDYPKCTLAYTLSIAYWLSIDTREEGELPWQGDKSIPTVARKSSPHPELNAP